MSRADVMGSEAADEPDAWARAVAGNGNGAAASLLSLQVVEDIGQVDALAWNDLLGACAAPTPFMRHEYLHALQRSGSAVAATGWQPVYLMLSESAPASGSHDAGDHAGVGPVTRAEAGRLVGACALYLKSHSYGEYEVLCRMTMDVQIEERCGCTWLQLQTTAARRLSVISGHVQVSA